MLWADETHFHIYTLWDTLSSGKVIQKHSRLASFNGGFCHCKNCVVRCLIDIDICILTQARSSISHKESQYKVRTAYDQLNYKIGWISGYQVWEDSEDNHSNQEKTEFVRPQLPQTRLTTSGNWVSNRNVAFLGGGIEKSTSPYTWLYNIIYMIYIYIY